MQTSKAIYIIVRDRATCTNLFLAYAEYRAMIMASTKLECSLVCRWVTLWGCKRVYRAPLVVLITN